MNFTVITNDASYAYDVHATSVTNTWPVSSELGQMLHEMKLHIRALWLAQRRERKRRRGRGCKRMRRGR